MIVVLKPSATEENIQHIIEKAEKMGLRVNVSRGVERTVVGFIGPEDKLAIIPLETFPGVDKVMPVLSPYKLVSREFKGEDTVIRLPHGAVIGGKKAMVMAGPCSIEGYEMLVMIAKMVKAAGATVLRAGAFKPRTSPYDFQGMGEEGLRILKRVSNEVGIATVTEVMDPRDVELVGEFADILQFDARTMQKFSMHQEIGSV